MTERTLNTKAKTIIELKAQIKELEEKVEKLSDDIKSEMCNDTELDTNKYLIKWIFVSSTKFDTKTFEKTHPDMYRLFSKENKYRRFTVSER